MHKKILWLTLLVPIIKPVVPGEDTFSIRFSSSKIGPYEEFCDDEKINFEYKVLSSEVETVYEVISVSDGRNGSLYYSTKFAKHKAKINEEYDLPFNLELKNYFSENGFKISVDFYNGNTNGKLISFFQNIYPIKKQREYHIFKDDVTRITTGTLSYYYINNRVISEYDDFNFIGTKDYIDANKYFKLDISNNSFLYNRQQLAYKEAYLSFYDEEHAFSKMSHDDKGMIKIPLKLYCENENFKFDFKNKFYVNRISLQSCEFPLDGYVETNDLFLPVNSKQYLLGKTLKITVLETGLSKCNLIFDLDFDVQQGIIGNCNSNDYCIKGQVD